MLAGEDGVRDERDRDEEERRRDLDVAAAEDAERDDATAPGGARRARERHRHPPPSLLARRFQPREAEEVDERERRREGGHDRDGEEEGTCASSARPVEEARGEHADERDDRAVPVRDPEHAEVPDLRDVLPGVDERAREEDAGRDHALGDLRAGREEDEARHPEREGCAEDDEPGARLATEPQRDEARRQCDGPERVEDEHRERRHAGHARLPNRRGLRGSRTRSSSRRERVASRPRRASRHPRADASDLAFPAGKRSARTRNEACNTGRTLRSPRLPAGVRSTS